MELILVLPVLVSFLICLFVLPKWIQKCKQVGLLWEDMNKYGKPKNVASSGGIVVVMSFIIGVLVYVAMRTFVRGNMNGTNTEIFALISVLLILSIVGLTDDLLGWKHGGLSKRFRVLMALGASIPLIAIDAGQHFVTLPFFGPINLGIFYTVILLPLGVAGATTTYNFLAGFNGLEAGMGIIILTFLSFVAYVTGTPWLALVGMIMVASLIAFYFYNRVPAKVFPGDILTYSLGALIAAMAILGNFEKIALFVFIPFILEVVLKSRGKLKKHSFGIPQKDGSLEMPYDKVYGLTHLSIYLLKRVKKKVYERDVVYLIFAFQIVVCLLALILFVL